MTKEEAAQFLAQVLGTIPTTLEQHKKFLAALNILLGQGGKKEADPKLPESSL